MILWRNFSWVTIRLGKYSLAYQIALQRLEIMGNDQEWGLLFKSLNQVIDLARENGHGQIMVSYNFSNFRISFALKRCIIG
jgi:hypothetical protein